MEQAKEFRLPVQHIDMQQESFPGLILDLGGGGEGVVGKISGERVVAIDINLKELEETRNSALKVVMDARNLLFLGDSFDIVTCFFSMMYVPKRDRGQVIAEAKRVLKPNKNMIFWEAVIPPKEPDNPAVFVVPMEIALPGGSTISTSYGVPWKGQDHNLDDYLEIAETNELIVEHTETHENWFKLIVRK